jgi:hypothetical protein
MRSNFFVFGVRCLSINVIYEQVAVPQLASLKSVDFLDTCPVDLFKVFLMALDLFPAF